MLMEHLAESSSATVSGQLVLMLLITMVTANVTITWQALSILLCAWEVSPLGGRSGRKLEILDHL
jgi:hypothetical protein